MIINFNFITQRLLILMVNVYHDLASSLTSDGSCDILSSQPQRPRVCYVTGG